MHEHIDPGSRWAPSREERQLAFGDMTPDQQAPGPEIAFLAIIGPLDVGEFEIGPVLQPFSLRTIASRPALPGGGIDILCDLRCGTGHRRLPDPRAEVMIRADAEDIPLARSAQGLLDVANTVHAVGSHPGERNIRGDRTRDHLHRQRRLGRKPRSIGTCTASRRALSLVQTFGR